MRRGFTILEVLVALTVFVGSAVLLGSTYLNVLNGYAQIDSQGDYLDDVKYARAMLLAETDFDAVEKGMDFETVNGRRVSWKASIESTEMADLFTVNFECQIDGMDLKNSVRINETFRLLRPTWSKPDERDKLRAATRTRIEQLQNNQANQSKNP